MHFDLSLPPPGPFDVLDPTLRRTTELFRNKDYTFFFIPEDRFMDFKAGEELGADASFAVKKHHCRAGKENTTRFRETRTLEELVITCKHGPEDLSAEIGVAQPRKPNTRCRGVELRGSCKRGCPVFFSAKRIEVVSKNMKCWKVQYLALEHKNHPTKDRNMKCCKSQTLLAASHPVSMPATSAHETPQVHQTPYFSQTCPTEERRMITALLVELTELVSCAPLESLTEINFGLRHLIANCKNTQSERAHLVEATAANVVIPNSDDDNSLKRKKDGLESLADPKRQKLPKTHGPPVIPVKPPQQKIGTSSVADELGAATPARAQSTQRPAQLQSKAAYTDPAPIPALK
eukprot:jgi/Botrbrau1/17974/Bobra.50_1s0063.1